MNNLFSLINKKFLTLIILSGFFATSHAAGIDDFILTIQTDNPGSSSDTEFIIPTIGGGYDYNVDCNDDGIDEFVAQAGDVTCDYSLLGGAGTYRVRIEDNTGAGTGFPRIFFNFSGDREKIIGINQWGTGQWNSMNSAFRGCSNLNDAGGAATDTPDLSSVTDMSSMFAVASAFNQDISSWDTSSVTDMGNMFRNANAFNQNLGAWDVTSLLEAVNMFANIALSAANYDSLLNGWDGQVL